MTIAVPQIALETRSVTKIYDGDSSKIHAVDGVSLQVKLGEFVALVGPSGSGKTTMLAILAALLKPTSGRVFLDGIDLGSLNRYPTGEITPFKNWFHFSSQQPGTLPDRPGKRPAYAQAEPLPGPVR